MRWKADKLWMSLVLCWMATVFFSYFGSGLLIMEVPMVGGLYPFRILLPITAVLYLLWAFQTKEHVFRDSSTLEKWCYVLIAAMLVYGVVSLFRAIDFMWTFRRLFNLSFDLCFFFLTLRLCRHKEVFRYSLHVCAVAFILLCVAGIYEVFCGGILDDAYDHYKRFELMGTFFQAPVVTAGNTNDFSLILGFSCAIFLLAREWVPFNAQSKILYYSPLLLMPAAYFLAVAGSSRLIICSYWALLSGLFLAVLINNRRAWWILSIIVVLFLGTHFISQYRYIVPPIKQYIVEMKEYHQQ